MRARSIVVFEPIVAAEPNAAVDDALRADDRPLAERDLRIDVRLRANLAALADEDLRLDNRAVADFRALLDNSEGADVDVLPELCGRVYDGRRMDAGSADGLGRRKHLRRRHAGVVRVGDADYRARRPLVPIGRQEDRRRLRRLDELDVLRVLAETQVSGPGLFKPSAGRELDVLALKRSAEDLRELTCLHPSPCPSRASGRRPWPSECRRLRRATSWRTP